MSTFCGWVDFSGAPFRRPETQPTRSRDGMLYLWADVRLDNREELIESLGGLFEGNRPGDDELVLAAYLRWGESCPERLLGDFAFAVWDVRLCQLFLARDPLGIKPLHYSRAGALLSFGSEARQVLGHPAVSRRLDEVSVGDYLAGCFSDPGRTFFRDVRRLPPAHRLVATPAGDRVERFWDLDPEARTVYRREEEYTEHFRELLSKAVESRLPASGPAVGVLMSGGLDSCSVAGMARQLLPPGSSPALFAGSFVFDRLRQCDEREHIRKVAAHLEMDVELVPAERFPVFGDPEAYQPQLETPFLAWEGCFQEMLSRVRDRGAQVLLTGHGGDDLMAGSALVYADRIRRGDLRALLAVLRHAASRGRAWRWTLYHFLARPLLPGSIDRILRRLSGRQPGPGLPDWIDPGFARRTGLAERLEAAPQRRFRELARQALYDHFREASWDQIVHWYDRNAAGFGIEVRHPYLDRRLVEYLFSIPTDRLFRTGLSKPLLRSAAAGLLPESVRLRPDKTKLGAFLDAGLRDQRHRIEPLLAAPLAADLGYVDGDRMRAAYRRYQQEEPNEALRTLWYALTLEVWLRKYSMPLDEKAAPVESSSAA
ncbi:MAG: hypothetical protein QOH06_5312 [Acidobacteriota bacterium]|nr:hypothetical protein [Acidobacteriota bacterium]